MGKLIKSRGELICVNPNDSRELLWSADGQKWKILYRFDDKIVDIIDDDGAGLLALTSTGDLIFSKDGDRWKLVFRF